MPNPQIKEYLTLIRLGLMPVTSRVKIVVVTVCSNYNRLIRPVANNTDKITVKMGLKLSQLVDLVSEAVK